MATVLNQCATALDLPHAQQLSSGDAKSSPRLHSWPGRKAPSRQCSDIAGQSAPNWLAQPAVSTHAFAPLPHTQQFASGDAYPSPPLHSDPGRKAADAQYSAAYSAQPAPNGFVHPGVSRHGAAARSLPQAQHARSG